MHSISALLKLSPNKSMSLEEFVLNGPRDTWGIPHEPIGKLLNDSLTTFDENIVAVISATTGESLTYAQLYQMGKNVAQSLRLLGVTKHDVIALVAENSSEFLVGYLAALFIAVPVHLINPKFTQYELANTLQLSEPSVLLCTKKTHQKINDFVKDVDYVKTVICLNVEKILPACRYKSDFFRVENDVNTEDDTAVICNSSGTTGLPKAVMINHEMLRLHFIHARDPTFLAMKTGDKHLLVLAFFHIYALFVVNGALFNGVTMIILDTFEPNVFLNTIQKYKLEMLLLVPTLVNFCIKSLLVDNYDLSCVRRVVCGGSSVPEEDVEVLRNRFKLDRWLNGYGMTEAGIVLQTQDNIKSVGKLLCGYQVKIVGLEKRQSLPPYQCGELCIKGPIMKGYIKNEEKTKEVIDSDGFLRSGDIGYYDEHGYVYINGRIKEIIKYKSSQVAPVELEHILLKLKGIKDVAVVGKPDRKFGELPTAAVVKEDGIAVSEKEICDYLAKFVNEDKRLHGGVRFVDTIPKNTIGKILCHELVKQLFNE